MAASGAYGAGTVYRIVPDAPQVYSAAPVAPPRGLVGSPGAGADIGSGRGSGDGWGDGSGKGGAFPWWIVAVVAVVVVVGAKSR